MLESLALLLLIAARLDPCVATLESERPLASTSLGDLRGTWQTSALGRRYAAFTSVPYAKPPVGALRFEPPEPLESWLGEWDASSPAPLCMAYTHLIGEHDTQRIKGQEDCLFLNVFTPRLPRAGEKVEDADLLDVIVYIHGGAFMFGESAGYGPVMIMDRDVVFITINYRVGPLGFLSLEDPAQPGNHGMRDQVAALQWIQDHITNFGGNPGSVTLTGGSAGGASVHFHYLSQLSWGLFHRGISLSGTALCRWALADRAREKALKLAANVGCPESLGSLKLIACLKQRPAEQILMEVEKFQVWQYSPFSPFAPVPELKYLRGATPPFLPEWPVKILRSGIMKRAPWMTGVTTAEGLYPAGAFVADEAELALLERDFTRLVPHLLDYNLTVEAARRDDVSRAIREHYFGAAHVDHRTVPQIIKMVGDRLFVVDAQRAAELHAKFAPTYFYQFSYRGKSSLSDAMSDTTRDFGASHADDVSYVMSVPYIHYEKHTGDDLRIEQLLLDLWTSFAKSGVPESSGVQWEPVSSGGELEFLHIGHDAPAMESSADLGDAAFWESLPINEPEQSVDTPRTEKKDEL